MSLSEKLSEDLKSAIFAKDSLKTETIRFLIADMKNYKIEKQRELTDEDVITLIERQVKRHRESIEGFEKGNRPEMAEKERNELEILQGYLPEQISPEEIERSVVEAINSTGAASISDMGRVMGALSHLRGKADFTVVSQLVKEKLT
jgi:hypothetical protein